MAPRGSRRDVMDADISYDMARLFDPYNFDHISPERRLDLFKQRDLPHIKHYKAAVKIFGGPQRRTRVIIAPPMETPLKHRLGVYHNVMVPPSPPALNGPLRPPPEPVKELTKEEKAQQQEMEKIADYKSWMSKRKQLRNNLDNLGLNEDFLARKPDKSELEKRVQAKYRADRLWKPESPPPKETAPSPQPLPDVPEMTVPPPDGLQILDKFLSLNRMRLMDLFLLADKDKSWTISREEFLNVATKAEIPLAESEVDDMIIALDTDLDDELSYKEMNKGLIEWRRQRRDIKRTGGDDKLSVVASAEQQPKSISAQAETDPRLGSREPSKIDKDSRPCTKEHSLGSKPLSREQSKDRITTDKSTKSTPMPTPRDRASKSSDKKPSALSQEVTETTGEGDQMTKMDVREKSDLESSKKSTGEAKAESSQDFTNAETSLPVSQQGGRGRTSEMVSSNMLFSQENMSADKYSETLPLDSQMDKSLYEDMLFQSEDTPRPTVTAQDIGEEEEDSEMISTDQEQKRASSASGTRPGSHKASSSSHSRASTPNSLELPEPDLRQEARVPGSAEAMVDMRKHDRVVLSRNNMRRSLSREKRITFDELPGVIKVGYKPIDDHCSESTMGGEMAMMVDQFRREKLKEYFEVRKLFEERDIPFTQKTLDRVLLYPGDRPTNSLRKNVTLPLGPLTDEHTPFSQPKPKKRSKKGRRGMRHISRASHMTPVGGGTAGDAAGADGGAGAGGAGNDLGNKNGGGSVGGIGGGPRKFGGPSGRHFPSEERSGSGGSKSYITVEDVYPFASSVAPKVHKENLSSGRALITRKIDNWITFEEYTKYTEKFQHRFQHLNRKSNPDAAWPGYLLDKVRLYMDEDLVVADGKGRPLENRDSHAYEGYGTGMYNGRGNAVFRHTAQPKRAYPGCNNDLLTWPVGENGVRYANVDEHRVIR